MTAIIPCALVLLWCVAIALFNIGAMAVGAAPITSVIDVFVWGLIGAATGVTLFWLLQAMGAARRLEQQQLFAAQYWHYQQQQQQPSGYGYGAPAASQPPANSQNWLNLPPPPPPPPPPGPTAPPPAGDSA
jgi:type II secretory pathway pseudopilin PulG